MAISREQARGIFTSELIEVYSDSMPPTQFLAEKFTVTESPTRYVSIEVERNNEYIAVDIQRGADPNRNTFSKSTEKIYEPPYYNEYFDATQLDIYDRVMAAPNDAVVMTEALQQFGKKLSTITDKIKRRTEVTISEIFEFGTATFTNAEVINFKRKAESMVNLTGAYWSTGSVDPATVAEAAGNFLRTKGKIRGGVIDMICGSSALTALLSNTTFQAKADLRRFDLNNVLMPNKNALGATYHGTFAAGSYTINIWSYPEFYDASAASKGVPYINPKKVIFLPQSTNFNLAYAAVPKLIGDGPSKGAFHVYDYMDEKNTAHMFGVKSAPVPILTGVDQVYTAQVLA